MAGGGRDIVAVRRGMAMVGYGGAWGQVAQVGSFGQWQAGGTAPAHQQGPRRGGDWRQRRRCGRGGLRGREPSLLGGGERGGQRR